MVTTVGTERNYVKLIASLVELEHDAIAAYEACEKRLEDATRRAKIAEFKEDHLRHVRDLRELASQDGIDTPDEGGMKQMLTIGKVAVAGLMGDGAILKAMATNEDDTVAAYERARDHDDAPEAARRLFARAHEDELRHRAWMRAEADAA